MAEPLGTVKKGMGPPPEVLNYFRDRQLTPRFSWLDVWGEEHANAFTVAKAVDLQLLGTFKASIDKALSNGQTFENWRAEIKKELQAQGWWGPRMVSDPTGRDPDRMVDFSRSRRLEVIFRSNMSAARAAGQWERAQRTKKVLPYLLYLRTTSTDPRPEHLKLAGIILPIDDPFWRTYFRRMAGSANATSGRSRRPRRKPNSAARRRTARSPTPTRRRISAHRAGTGTAAPVW